MGAVCLIALRRGRFDERLAAGGYLVSWLLTVLAYRVSDRAETVVLVLDLALLGLVIWIALRTRRYWPLLAAGFQVLAVATHVARHADTTVSTWAYLTAEIVWGYLAIFSIGYGAWTAPKRYAMAADEPNAAPGATRR